ncbi:hypothetical protein PG984_014621 [Apiospora sp. TS-2023a]
MSIRVSCFGRPFVEDYLMLAALILLLASTIMSPLFLRYIYQMEGVSNGALPPPDFLEETAKGLRGFLSMMYLSYVGIWLVKLNFLLFFRRFGHHVPKYRITWWIVLLFNLGAGATCIALIDLKCTLTPPNLLFPNCSNTAFIKKISTTTNISAGFDAAGDALSTIPSSIPNTVSNKCLQMPG